MKVWAVFSYAQKMKGVSQMETFLSIVGAIAVSAAGIYAVIRIGAAVDGRPW